MKKYILLLFLLPVILLSAERSGDREILNHPLWKQGFDEYTVNREIVEILQSKIREIDSIDVYFAFWCGDSVNNVPPFIKIVNAIEEKHLKINYFKVKRKQSGEKYYYKKLRVERVPTFIFFKDEKEIGRIIENPKKNIEEDILEILLSTLDK